MYSKILSGAALGVDGMLINVETDMSQGLPGLSLVGYLAASVKEAGDRVRAALKNVGFFLPSKKIITNLSPADIRKDGTSYDLAIAVSILISMGTFSFDEEYYRGLSETVFLGELGLDGSILPVSGVLPIVDHAVSRGIRRAVVPYDNAREASFVRGIEVIGVKHLNELIEDFAFRKWPEPYEPESIVGSPEDTAIDLAEVKGQEVMKRGLVIAVAGFHNVIMTGAAGAGKSMIAKCIPGIMPAMSYKEQMELTKIYSVADMLNMDEGLMTRRPFRSPSQSISEIALCGGGTIPKPGEVSLANGGVLFLDEFPEFRRNVIESLRQPMEDGKITISRLRGIYTFPSRFMLVSARNNCPCGFYPDRNRCRCTAGEIYNYQNRISHPIMDRIDIRLEVKPIGFEELSKDSVGMTSSDARRLIERARRRQEERYRDEDFSFNSEIPQGMIERYIKLGDAERDRLKGIYEKAAMSARGYYRMLRMIRTIADIEDREDIRLSDIDEACFFRNESDFREGIIC